MDPRPSLRSSFTKYTISILRRSDEQAVLGETRSVQDVVRPTSPGQQRINECADELHRVHHSESRETVLSGSDHNLESGLFSNWSPTKRDERVADLAYIVFALLLLKYQYLNSCSRHINKEATLYIRSKMFRTTESYNFNNKANICSFQ